MGMGMEGKVILLEGKHQKRFKLMLELNLKDDVLARWTRRKRE